MNKSSQMFSPPSMYKNLHMEVFKVWVLIYQGAMVALGHENAKLWSVVTFLTMVS